MVNRYWGYLMGKGLVNPIDDLRETNPPSNPELLDALADAFVASGYDLKALLRLILTSRVYQFSALATPENRLDTTFFTHYTIKRLTAEQLLDAHRRGDRARSRSFPSCPPAPGRSRCPTPTTRRSSSTRSAGRLRAIACECERSGDPNLSQALHLMNGDLVNRKLLQADGRLARLLEDPKLTDAALVTPALPPDVQPPAHAPPRRRGAGRSSPRPRAGPPGPRTCSGRCSIPRNFCSTIDWRC